MQGYAYYTKLKVDFLKKLTWCIRKEIRREGIDPVWHSLIDVYNIYTLLLISFPLYHVE